MADDLDRARERQEALNEQALADHRHRRTNRISYTHCEECDEKIPEARRVAAPGCTRCIDCQTEHEETLKHWRPM